MDKDIKISENEKKCLEVLIADSGSYEGEYCLAFKQIMGETNFTYKEVRRFVRSLARKGLAVFYRGLMSEDENKVAGSGYTVSEKGRLLFNKLNP